MTGEKDEIVRFLAREILAQAKLKNTTEELIRIYNAIIIELQNCMKEVLDNGSIIKENHSNLVFRATEKMFTLFLTNDTKEEKVRVLSIMINSANDQMSELNRSNSDNSSINYIATDERKNNFKKPEINNKRTLVDEIKCRQMSKKYLFNKEDSYENSFTQDIFCVLLVECCYRNIDINQIINDNVLYLTISIKNNNFIIDDVILYNIHRFSNLCKETVQKYNNLNDISRQNIIINIENLLIQFDNKKYL